MISRKGLNIPKNMQIVKADYCKAAVEPHSKEKKIRLQKGVVESLRSTQRHKGRRVPNRALSCWLSAPSLAVRFIGRDSGLLSFRQNSRRFCWVNTVHPGEGSGQASFFSPLPLPAEKSKGVKWQLEKASWLLTVLGCSKPQLLSLL